MRERLGKMVLGNSKAGDLVTVVDLGVGGAALTSSMGDAINPILMQTLSRSPCACPWMPIREHCPRGNSYIMADKFALELVGPGGFVVTEAEFTQILNLRKNIKFRYSGLTLHCTDIVTTITTLKMQRGGPELVAGKPLDGAYVKENIGLVKAGCVNLAWHVSNMKAYGVNVVVAVNMFSIHTEAKLNALKSWRRALDAVICAHHAHVGKGAVSCISSK